MTNRDPSTSLRLCKRNQTKPISERAKRNPERERLRLQIARYPLIEVDVEFVKGDVRCGDEYLFHEWVDSLKHRQIQHFGALLVKIWHQLSALRRHPLLQGFIEKRKTIKP